MGKIMMRQMVLGMVATNCYLIYDDETMETILVDPADGAAQLINWIEENGLKPMVILLTHGHFDHIKAVPELRKQYGIPALCHETESSIMESPEWNLSLMFETGFGMRADGSFVDGEILRYIGRTIRVLHTPGHTKGSCCFYFEQENFLVSGDTLFAESVGRTDFPTGSTAQLLESIREKLFVLPEETTVYPGHNESTTIGHEKRYNPCIKA